MQVPECNAAELQQRLGDGADGSISVKLEGLEADQFEQGVLMRRWESWTNLRTKAPLHRAL